MFHACKAARIVKETPINSRRGVLVRSKTALQFLWMGRFEVGFGGRQATPRSSAACTHAAQNPEEPQVPMNRGERQ